MLSLERLKCLDEYRDDRLHALYDLCSRRFIYVNSNENLLEHISLLFSSRYTLYVCRLDCAENFAPNIVDNDVALNWGIDFSASNSFRLGDISHLRYVLNVPKLIELGPPSKLSLPINDLPYIKYVVELIQNLTATLPDRIDGYVNEIDLLYNDIIGAPFVHTRTTLYKNIFSIIYNNPDLNAARLEINKLLKEYGSIFTSSTKDA